MAFPLNTLSLVGGALVWGFGKLRDKRKAEADAAEARQAWHAPGFENPDDVKEFTEDVEGERRFQPDIREALVKMLDVRSLEPLPPSELSEDPEEIKALGALGTFYAIVPLSDTLANAGQVIRECEKAGAIVAGSLTLIFLPSGIDVPLLLVVGGQSLAKACNDKGEIALLSTPVAKREETKPELVKVEPAPEPVANGATASPSYDKATVHQLLSKE